MCDLERFSQIQSHIQEHHHIICTYSAGYLYTINVMFNNSNCQCLMLSRYNLNLDRYFNNLCTSHLTNLPSLLNFLQKLSMQALTPQFPVCSCRKALLNKAND